MTIVLPPNKRSLSVLALFDVTLVAELKMTTRELADTSFRLFISRIPHDQLVILLSGVKRPQFLCIPLR